MASDGTLQMQDDELEQDIAHDEIAREVVSELIIRLESTLGRDEEVTAASDAAILTGKNMARHEETRNEANRAKLGEEGLEALHEEALEKSVDDNTSEMDEWERQALIEQQEQIEKDLRLLSALEERRRGLTTAPQNQARD